MAKTGWTEKDLQAAGGCGCVIVVALLLLLLFMIQAVGGLNIQYSEGSRSGTVTKISKKGWVWQTWEGELDLHRLKSTGGENPTMTADIFYFSVASDEVAQQVQEAERRGTRATIHYKQYLMRGFKYGKTSYDITAVDISDDQTEPHASGAIR